MNLQGLIWNCRGLKKKGTSTFLKTLIQQNQFHLIGLQETMIENCEESLLRNFDPQQEYLWLWNPSWGRSGGILVGTRVESYEIGSFKQGDYMIQLNLWDKQVKAKWNLIVVYGDAQEEGKIPFLTELSNFCSNSSEPMLIGRDFNVIRYAKERRSNNGVHRHTGLFNSLTNFHELHEIGMTGGIFTLSNNLDPPTLEKLDRILISNGWEELYPQVMVRKLPWEISDHNPLIISSGSAKKPPNTIQI